MNLLALFLQPVFLTKHQQLLMLLPLCLSVAVVYKTTKIENLREIPLAAVVSFVTIVLGMFGVGVALLAVYKIMA